MAEVVDILVSNLKETFKAIERFLLLGFTASLVLVVLAITNRELAGTAKLTLADINAPAALVAALALGTYFASGAFSVFYFAARGRIVKRLLKHDPTIVDALLTYPSVVSQIGAGQIVALAVVGGSGMIALLLFYMPTHEVEKALLASAVIGSPYIALLGMAFMTAVRERSPSPPTDESADRTSATRGDGRHKLQKNGRRGR